ncbi:MAG: Clp protease N-terminal domain-containing protein [Hyphomicrobium sp.]
MAYRGEDLDLRTPQTWSATAAELAGAYDPQSPNNGQRGAYGNAPIWVDDTLLACSNHAFDIALAHRSGDVRLEHLLHALTRIESAAEALESRGVRVASLRRESATIIAAEIPVGLPTGKGSPRVSEDFGEVLRMAGAHASRRGEPAGINDLLFVLLDQRPDVPGIGLMLRHAPRLPPLREAVDLPPRYDPALRYASEARYAQPTQERYYKLEPPRPYRAEMAGATTDAIQNSRIDALEHLVRKLSSDLATERQVVAGLLHDLNRTANAQRDDQGRLQADLFDRLQSIEQVFTHGRGAGADEAVGERLAGFESTLDRRVQDMTQSWSTFAARLQSLEDSIRQSPGGLTSDGGGLFERLQEAIDLRPISSRLDIIEEAVLGRDYQGGASGDGSRSLDAAMSHAVSTIDAQVARVEAALADFGRRNAVFDPDAIEKVSNFASTIDEQSQRLAAVERAVTSEIETAAAKHQASAHDLSQVHDAIMKLNQNQHEIAGSIDQWRTDAAGDIAMISNRLTNLDRDNERPIETLNVLTSHMDTMNRMFIERYHRRNRFWYWLFGTDDWLGRSWPSQSAAMEADAERMSAPESA